MTNPSIPPCPVCGVVPIRDSQFADECKPECQHVRNQVATILIEDWSIDCEWCLGRALRAHGIHTIQQLTDRLDPDQRVAVLAADHTGMKISASGVLKATYPTREMYKHLKEVATRYYAGEISVVDEFLQLYDLAHDRPKLIAAQRGEVEG